MLYSTFTILLSCLSRWLSCPICNTQDSFLSLPCHFRIRADPGGSRCPDPAVFCHLRTACLILYCKKLLVQEHTLLLEQKYFPQWSWKGVNFLHSEVDLIMSKFISVWLMFLDFFSTSLKGWSCAYIYRSCHQWLKQHPAEESAIWQIVNYAFFLKTVDDEVHRHSL